MADKDTTKEPELTEAEKAADEAAEKVRENTARRNEIDAEYREAVREAADNRAAALADLDPTYSGNLAEAAWNETKPARDPDYSALAAPKRAQLDIVVDAVRTTGNADVVGLEDFEAKVAELLVAQGVTPGSPGTPNAALKEQMGEEGDEADSTSTTAVKSGRLPADFPHRAELERAGITTYAQARKLGGDYRDVDGVGEAKGREIDAAL